LNHIDFTHNDNLLLLHRLLKMHIIN